MPRHPYHNVRLLLSHSTKEIFFSQFILSPDLALDLVTGNPAFSKWTGTRWFWDPFQRKPFHDFFIFIPPEIILLPISCWWTAMKKSLWLNWRCSSRLGSQCKAHPYLVSLSATGRAVCRSTSVLRRTAGGCFHNILQQYFSTVLPSYKSWAYIEYFVSLLHQEEFAVTCSALTQK